MLFHRKPSRKLENKLHRQGYKLIAGLDEVGRGAWAGPIVSAAVILPPKLKIRGLKDSKDLSPKKRQELFLIITKNAVQYSISIISNTIIDKIGIGQANAKSFRKSIDALTKKPDYLLIDGLKLSDHPLPHQYIVQGDSKISSIAAASIVAKVTRDQIMQNLEKKYPQYGFAKHKGYGTLAHSQAINTHGLCQIHRTSFKISH